MAGRRLPVLVRAADGDKLSKQNGAAPLRTDTSAEALAALDAAARVLGLRSTTASSPAVALALWVPQWRDLYNARP